MVVDLYSMEPNQTGKISHIVDSNIRGRMMEMGFLKDQPIKILFKAPLSGPVAVYVLDSIVSLRKEEANLIKIKI
jgi:Fe2+ transport system protein FeoA